MERCTAGIVPRFHKDGYCIHWGMHMHATGAGITTITTLKIERIILA